MNKFIILILFFGLLACNQTKPKQNELSANTGKVNKDSLTISNDTLIAESPKPKNFQDTIAAFIQRRSAIIKKLKSLSKEEANRLYDTYSEENSQFLTELMDSQGYILENYYSEGMEGVIKQKSKSLKKANLEFWYIGEGYAEIRTENDFYYNIFSKYVTDDYKAYLALKKEEDKKLLTADAGLLISFKELGSRIFIWENFIKKYPQSRLLKRVMEDYKSYQLLYLTGLDNTPTIDRESNELLPENAEELNSFLKSHPNSPTSKLIKIVLENYKEKGKEIEKLIEEEQRKI